MKQLSWILLLGSLSCSGWETPARGQEALPASAPDPDASQAGGHGRDAGLPDSPGTVRATPSPTGKSTVRCPGGMLVTPTRGAPAQGMGGVAAPCAKLPSPYQPFLNSTAPSPLSVKQKGYLAVRDMVDPFNVLTILGNSAFTIGLDAHTGYGPGMRGFGRNVGVTALQESTGEFIGTFLVCSLFHEDPHYHRMVDARPLRRVVHAIGRTFLAQHDDGTLMPNYENLITYPASAEISNLYVPGVHGDAASTIQRILTGLATDPVSNLITEFLPDLAKRVHIRVVFVQQILNQIVADQQKGAPSS